MKLVEKYASRSGSSSDDNMVPLINVVFLMLVFFMVAGQIKKSDPIDIVPPSSINEARSETDPNVVLVVGQDGTIFMDDKEVLIIDIQPYLENEFVQSSNPDAFWVQIKADGQIELDTLRPVFQKIRQSGLVKVSIATQLERATP
ncbi:ExbD/TolR family protein [Marinomonas epiphytica]